MALTVKAQDSLRRAELGSTLLTINTFNTKYHYAQSRPSFEIMNGIFYRYRIKSCSIRGLASYSENKIDYTPPPGVIDGSSGSVQNTNVMFGVGIQTPFKKKKEWLYGFLDLCYRNTFSKGESKGGGFSNRYTASSNGIDGYFGLGFKIKIFKQLKLSPELTYNFNYSTCKSLNNFGNSVSRSTVQNFNLNSIFKIHLTAAF